MMWRSSITVAFGGHDGRMAGSGDAPVSDVVHAGGYIYDAPALFLSSACFLAFLKRQWWLF
jgi:hypothetical protein